MTVRNSNTLVRITCILLLLTLTTNYSAAMICDEGWIHTTDSDDIHMCSLPVKQPMDALTARKFCEDRVSYLVNLDHFDKYKHKYPDPNVVLTVPDSLVDDDFEEFWSGIRIAENIRLMSHEFIPIFLKRSKGDNFSWNWKPGQPSDDVNTCGLVTLGKREVINDAGGVTGGSTFVNNGSVTVEMLPCTEKHPFVCEKLIPYKYRWYFYETDYCPEGWKGNRHFTYCIRFVMEKVTFKTAQNRCGDMGGYMYVTNDPERDSLTKLMEVLIFNVSDTVKLIGYHQESWFQTVATWDNDTQGCPAHAINKPGISVTGRQPCDSLLSFMCMRNITTDGRYPINANTIEVSSPYLDQASLLTFPTWARLNVSARFQRPPKDNEIQFVHKPDGSTPTNLTEWLTTTNWYYEATMNSSMPYYENVTLPPLVPSLEGEIQDEFNTIFKTCGYYSFGSCRMYPTHCVETKPVLIRYSEKDLYIYVATVGLRSSVFATGVITEQDTIMRRLTNDESYTSALSEYAHDVLTSFGENRDDIVNYRGLIEDVSTRTMKVRVFVHPTSPRLLRNDFEQVLVPDLHHFFHLNLNSTYFETENIDIQGTVTCATLYNEEGKPLVTFPMTRAGELAYSWERCYKGAGALASVKCEGGYDDGTRGNVTYNTGCQTFPDLPESTSTDALQLVSEMNITIDNVDTIFRDTANLTLPTLKPTGADIIYTAKIFNNYLQSAVHKTIQLDDIFDVVNNVIQVDSDAINQAQELYNAANRILRAVDDLTNNFKPNTTGNQTIVRDYVASAVTYQTGESDTLIGLKLEKTDNNKITNESLSWIKNTTDVNRSQTDTAIYMSRNLTIGETTRLSFHIYSKTELFSAQQGRYSVNSKVTAGRLERNGKPILNLGDDRVTVVFEMLQVSDDAVCGYWDYSANQDAGGWRTDGCVSTINGSKIICECDHLTNFAVLMELEAGISQKHKAILAIVTKVGLSISIVALSLIPLTFVLFKHLRKGRGHKVLVNLSVAMLCSSVIFLVGMDRVETKTGCKVVAVLLHYFLLVSFAFMLVEGVLQYLRFVKVYATYIPNFMIKSMLPAWGISLIPVILVLAIDHDLYYGGKGYCWLEKKAMLYAFIIPVAIVIIVNLFLFVLVLQSLCCQPGMSTNQPQWKRDCLNLQGVVSTGIILGLTWFFGFMAIDKAQVVFEYIFVILNVFQGLFIVLLFSARSPKIREAWMKMCCKEYVYKHMSNGTGTDQNRRTNASDTSANTTCVTSLAMQEIYTFGNGTIHVE